MVRSNLTQGSIRLTYTVHFIWGVSTKAGQVFAWDTLWIQRKRHSLSASNGQSSAPVCPRNIIRLPPYGCWLTPGPANTSWGSRIPIARMRLEFSTGSKKFSPARLVFLRATRFRSSYWPTVDGQALHARVLCLLAREKVNHGPKYIRSIRRSIYGAAVVRFYATTKPRTARQLFFLFEAHRLLCSSFYFIVFSVQGYQAWLFLRFLKMFSV